MAIIPNGPRFTPADLEAAFDRVVELVQEWCHAEEHATYCTRSEKDDARGVADQAKDEVMAYLSHLLGGAR